jgi:hypothetical protein
MQVTEPDIFTVRTLKESGLTYTIVAHPPFIESFEFISAGMRLNLMFGSQQAMARWRRLRGTIWRKPRL